MSYFSTLYPYRFFKVSESASDSRCFVDAMGSMGMFFAGMVMVTRNRYVDALMQLAGHPCSPLDASCLK